MQAYSTMFHLRGLNLASFLTWWKRLYTCKIKILQLRSSAVESMRIIRRLSGDQWLALINIMVTKIKRSTEDNVNLSCSCCFSDKKIKWSVFMVTCNREPENYTGKSKEALKRCVNHFVLGFEAFSLTLVNIIILKTLWGHPLAVSSLFTEH